jgi:hypothetical protein
MRLGAAFQDKMRSENIWETENMAEVVRQSQGNWKERVERATPKRL